MAVVDKVGWAVMGMAVVHVQELIARASSLVWLVIMTTIPHLHPATVRVVDIYLPQISTLLIAHVSPLNRGLPPSMYIARNVSYLSDRKLFLGSENLVIPVLLGGFVADC